MRMANIAAATALLLAGTIAIETADAQGRGYGGRGQEQGQGQSPGPQQGRGSMPAQAQGRGSGPMVMQQSEIRERIRTRDIYGRDLMSAEERRRYLERVNAATSDGEWARIREQHMNEMRSRAQSRQQTLEPPVFGQHMMTRQERNEYTRRLESAQSDGERMRIQNEHQETMRNRARMLGLELPPAD